MIVNGVDVKYGKFGVAFFVGCILFGVLVISTVFMPFLSIDNKLLGGGIELLEERSDAAGAVIFLKDVNYKEPMSVWEIVDMADDAADILKTSYVHVDDVAVEGVTLIMWLPFICALAAIILALLRATKTSIIFSVIGLIVMIALYVFMVWVFKSIDITDIFSGYGSDSQIKSLLEEYGLSRNLDRIVSISYAAWVFMASVAAFIGLLSAQMIYSKKTNKNTCAAESGFAPIMTTDSQQMERQSIPVLESQPTLLQQQIVMVRCGNCNALNVEDAVFCKECGHSMFAKHE